MGQFVKIIFLLILMLFGNSYGTISVAVLEQIYWKKIILLTRIKAEWLLSEKGMP